VRIGTIRGTMPVVEPERFDDVGFEIIEAPDTGRRPRRPRRPRRRLVALGVLAGSIASLAAAAALAVTPAQAPQRQAGTGSHALSEFAAERYPARHQHGGPCRAGTAHPAGPRLRDEPPSPKY
jgi:hypothetical protein